MVYLRGIISILLAGKILYFFTVLLTGSGSKSSVFAIYESYKILAVFGRYYPLQSSSQQGCPGCRSNTAVYREIHRSLEKTPRQVAAVNWQ